MDIDNADAILDLWKAPRELRLKGRFDWLFPFADR